MSLTLLLTWFPILLGAGVGGRLLGRSRGFALGVLCGLFWVVLIQASQGARVWGDPWAVAMMIAGAFAIISIGAWAGEHAAILPEADRGAVLRETSGESAIEHHLLRSRELATIAGILDEFDDFLEAHRLDTDPWPEFDDFLRRVLYRACKATHVKPYRLLPEGLELAPLTQNDLITESRRVSATEGIIGETMDTGRAFLRTDLTNNRMAAVQRETDAAAAPAWCFAISQGTRRFGAVLVGQLDINPADHRTLLTVVEKLVSQFWCSLIEVYRSRTAALQDPTCGVLTREAFLAAAEQSLAESYAQSEPVAVSVIALEGLRDLNDTGRWDLADEMLHEVGMVLRRKIRLDDRLGRFDGSRFVVLFRRVDADLAGLIVAQMISRLSTLCGDRKRWHSAITVRAGVVCSHSDKPDLKTLVTGALELVHTARKNKLSLATDTRAGSEIVSCQS